jgi:hypothetical protein
MNNMMSDFWGGINPVLKGMIIGLMILHLMPLVLVLMYFWWNLIL